MTVALPPPVPLPQPPGSSDALAAVLDQLVLAGWSAGLAVHLLEPAVVLTGWQGADATVAATEVGAALGVAVDLHEALTSAQQRLAGHHELWLAVRARTAQLVDDQRARYADAATRLALLVGTAVDAGDPVVVPAARALVDAVAREDTARGQEHQALLTALSDDAVATAATLASASQRFGVPGRRGDGAAVTVQLAGRLPGWGTGAVAALGEEAGGELAGARSVADLAAAALRWRPFAAVPGFAGALLGRLGSGGVTWLLSVLADVAGTPDQEPLAALLAASLGAVGARSGGPGAEVLDAVRLDPADGDAVGDRLGTAMGLVLAAGAGSALAARWGRQLLAREAVQGARAGVGGAGDPVAAALAEVARAGDAEAAVQLLDDPQAWRTLLSRPWPAGAGPLDAVIGLSIAAADSGRAARAALLALGQGLGPGSTGRALDDAGALTEVREALTALVAARVEVVLPVLDAASTGADTDGDTALHGLGYLTADAEAAHAVTAAVQDALRAGAAGSSAGEVAGALVAVLEYGQRVGYALAWAHEQVRAVDRETLWLVGVRPWVLAAQSRLGEVGGEVVGVVEGAVADVLDMNGDVEIGPDTGEVRTGDDAASFATGTIGPAPAVGALVAPAVAARVGFARASAVLGTLTPPVDSLLDRLDELPVPNGPRRPGRE